MAAGKEKQSEKILKIRGKEPSLFEKWICLNLVLQGQKEMQQKSKSAQNKIETLQQKGSYWAALQTPSDVQSSAAGSLAQRFGPILLGCTGARSH